MFNLRFTFFFLFMYVILLSGCINSGKKAEQTSGDEQAVNTVVSGTLNVEGDDVLFALMNDLIYDFRRVYPNVEVNFALSNSESAFRSLDAGEIDVAFVSTPVRMISNTTYTAFPFVRDLIVLILNFDNQYLQTLVIHGVSQKVLSGILSMNITDWRGINKKIEGNEPLKMYIPPKTSGTVEYIAGFAGLSKDKIKADDVIIEKDIPANVANLQIAMGMCSHTLAYDHSTQFRRGGLYIVGIDVNNNGILDNEELIYDDLSEVINAVKYNKAPADLVREFSLCYRNENPNRELAELFIKHIIQHGKLFIEKHKFLPVDIQNKTQ
jgi:ABC-type phosphate transport system substrate-binding protein